MSTRDEDDTTAATRAVVERFYELASTGQADAIAEILDPEVVNWEAGSLPYGGVYRGREQVVGLLHLLFDGIDLTTVNHIAILAEGHRAASFLEVPFAFGSPAAPSLMPVIETFVVHSGLITEIRPYYFDSAAIAVARN